MSRLTGNTASVSILLQLLVACELKTSNTRYLLLVFFYRPPDNGEGFAEFLLVDGKPSWTGNSPSDQSKQKQKLVIYASNMTVRQFSF